jgi:hypothetical protein
MMMLTLRQAAILVVMVAWLVLGVVHSPRLPKSSAHIPQAVVQAANSPDVVSLVVVSC